ncbi:MAG: PD40 domain-containing protein [Ahniella sp.]|nr:PD40 domain-containing protein [Ahniella sp.]
MSPRDDEPLPELLGVADLARIRPLTSDPGYEYRADLSADGRWFVYTQSDRDGGPSRLWFQDIEGQHPELLTAPGDHEFRPALSPDGKQIAFLRRDDFSCGVHVRATTGGASRRLADCGFPGGTPAWSSDQRALVFTAVAEPGFAAGLSLIDLHTGKVSTLTRPTLAEGPDRDAEWVPKQRRISFARGYDGEQHLLQIDLDAPEQAPTVLFDAGRLQGHAWYHDGSQLLVASDAPGYRTLLLLEASGRQRAILNTRGAQFPAWADNGELVFEQALYDANIERLDLTSPDARPEPVVASTRYDASPVLSPDGRSLAFVSNRDDFEHVYVADLDGQNPTRVEFSEGARWSRPSFSPDGRFIIATGYDTHNINWIYRFDRLREQSEQMKELGAHATGARYHPDANGYVYMPRPTRGAQSVAI